MLNNIFLKTLRDQRRSLLLWGGYLVAIGVLMALFYPTISSMTSFNQYLNQLPEGVKEMFGAGLVDYTSPVGYFSTELFSFMVPLLLLVFGIGFGANAIAGEEEKGTLGFLLTNPVPRWRVVADKFAVLVVSMVLLGFFFWAGLAITVSAMSIDINLLQLAEATLGACALALVFAAVAFLAGCVKGSKGMSMGVASGLAVLTYLLNTLGGVVNGLKNYRFLSPFYHYMEPDTLKNGLSPVHILVLLGLVIVFFAFSIPAFIRRDIAR
jgi:ABC-2 type transport system permease protein